MALEALPNGVSGQLTQADIDRTVTLSVAESTEDSRLPWAGHLGLSLETCEPASGFGRTTILFTNTRNQAEQYRRQALWTRSRNRPSSWITGSGGPTRCRKATQAGRY